MTPVRRPYAPFITVTPPLIPTQPWPCVYDKYTAATGDATGTIVASTASPFKFNASVARAILGEDAVRDKDEFKLLEALSAASNLEIPAGLKDLNTKQVRHGEVTSKEQMRKSVQSILSPQ